VEFWKRTKNQRKGEPPIVVTEIIDWTPGHQEVGILRRGSRPDVTIEVLIPSGGKVMMWRGGTRTESMKANWVWGSMGDSEPVKELSGD